jgi:hypothetical protein
MELRMFGWFVVFAMGAPMGIRAQAPAPDRPPDTSPRAVIAKAVSYITGYQKALEFVLADERNIQEVLNADDVRVARREASGDFFLSYVAAEGGWLSVRDVMVVDGEPVENRGNLRQLLSRGSSARIGRQLADRNARYNIGSIARNFNDPMLALVILDDKHRDRFRFERRAVEQTPDGPLVTITFTERERPTLVRGSDGSQIFARGELVIEAATGLLRRTFITLKDGGLTASLTTTFTANTKLDLWLPASLTERYEGTANRLREVVVAESTYTNYRKFDVSVIIK